MHYPHRGPPTCNFPRGVERRLSPTPSSVTQPFTLFIQPPDFPWLRARSSFSLFLPLSPLFFLSHLLSLSCAHYTARCIERNWRFLLHLRGGPSNDRRGWRRKGCKDTGGGGEREKERGAQKQRARDVGGVATESPTRFAGKPSPTETRRGEGNGQGGSGRERGALGMVAAGGCRVEYQPTRSSRTCTGVSSVSPELA